MNTGLQNAGTNLQSPLRFAISQEPDVRVLLTRDDAASVARLNEVSRQRNVPIWTNTFKFYGPEEVVRAQWAYTKRRLGSITNSRFVDGAFYKMPLTEEQKLTLRDEQDLGVPTLGTFSIGARSAQNPTPTTGHLGFSPVIPMTGEAVIESQRVFSRVLQESGRDVAANVFPLSYHPRTFVILVMFSVMHHVESNRATRTLFKRLIDVAAEHGWGEYRTHTAFMDDVGKTYSFNNHALLRLHERLKDAVDPNGIISAGRYGIWPRHLRRG
jgi:4-cresol dehydrogenase (hydroxylating)